MEQISINKNILMELGKLKSNRINKKDKLMEIKRQLQFYKNIIKVYIFKQFKKEKANKIMELAKAKKVELY